MLHSRGAELWDIRCPIGRTALCEWLTSHRMRPIGAADVAAAVQALDAARRAGRPFEILLVCPEPVERGVVAPLLAALASGPGTTGAQALLFAFTDTSVSGGGVAQQQ